MKNQKIFKNVVLFLFELQHKQSIDDIVFYPGMDIDIDVYDLYECLIKLQKDYGLIKEITPSFMFEYPYNPQSPYPYSGYNEYNFWELQLNPEFAEWAENYLNIKTADGTLQIMQIRYLPDRRIVLNDQYILSKPNFNSENDNLFSFLYKNPNKLFSKSEIKEQAGITVNKGFDKFVENLNFKNDLRKIFFKVSKTHILFRNPVSKQQVEEMGIRYIKL